MLRVVSGAAILFEHACSDGSIRFGSILYCVLCVCTMVESSPHGLK
jgi:hypothetical protein